jgi:hypothetical protein
MTEKIPPLAINGSIEQGDYLTGFLDVLFGLGVALANAGLVTREEIAAAMTNVRAQLLVRDASPARMFPVRVMESLFAAQIIGDPKRRFAVYDGGRPDDLPPAA